ncbi:MAG: glycosyltransferase family 4 protein [Gammaproteobacteria bacterium]|nr:glycosyltransferase family 4 protein [Gammaproteobacteria bacterium]
MNLAFCLFNYFPYGGLQRDFLRIAQTCQQRGHHIHVYTMSWEGEKPQGFLLHLIEANGWQNHTRCHSFVKKLKKELAHQAHELVIGFNKMPSLDIYYAADVCYQARTQTQRSRWYRWLPRYQQLSALEKAVFARGQSTEILLISPLQQNEFVRYYHTEKERFHLLPPGIAKDRIAPTNAADIRKKIRNKYQLHPHHYLLLMVGSGFKTKGVDRSIQALATLPAELKERCRLFVIGQDDPTYFQKLAARLNVSAQLQFLGGRPDVPDFLLAADLLLHPAYHENTGTVLLEALAAGLPVLTVDCCGYAHYIRDSHSGVVLASPFQQAAFNTTLQKMLLSAQRIQWQENALTFAKQANIYSLPDEAANLIDQLGKKRGFLLRSAN